LTGASWFAGSLPDNSPQVFLALAFLAFSAMVLELAAVELPYAGYASTALCVYVAGFIVIGLPYTVTAAYGALLVGAIGRAFFLAPHEPGRRRMVDACGVLMPLMAAGLAYHFTAGSDGQANVLFVGILAAAAAYAVVDLFIMAVQRQFVDPGEEGLWTVQRRRAMLIALSMFPAGLVMAVLEKMGNSYYLMSLLVLVPVAMLRFAHTGGAATEERRNPQADDVETTLSLVQSELNEYKAQNKLVMIDLQKRVDEIAILSETGQLLGASLDLAKTLEVIIEKIRKLIVYQSCVIFLMDNHGALSPARAVSPFREQLEHQQLLQLEESIVTVVLQSRKPLLQVVLNGDSSQRIFKDEQSVMCVPLIVKNEIIGVIYVGTLRPGAYSGDHVHLLEMLASPAAIAIKSAQLFEEQELKARQLEYANKQSDLKLKQQEHLKDLANHLAQAEDLKTTEHIAVDRVLQILNAKSCALFVPTRSGETTTWSVAACVSPYENILKIYQSTPGDPKGLLEYVSHLRTPVLVGDAKKVIFPDNPIVTNDILVNERSLLLAPLRAKETLNAILYVGQSDADRFSPEDKNLFEMLSIPIATELEKALMWEKTKEQAITDGVTSLYTHRYFQERLIEEVKWSERVRKPLSLIMVDTDHFKKFNDTLGHPQGDALLREIATLLKDSCRDSDLVCRYGGDEFSMILKETDKEGARKIAERIREAFELRLGRHKVKVTSSIGVACFPVDATTKADLVKAADAALYESKHNGRNQVRVAQSLATRPLKPIPTDTDSAPATILIDDGR
ncbi:MAG: sensor domain-containing diguanylate cyclase, partial [Candidatus Xenobia bacterium]